MGELGPGLVSGQISPGMPVGIVQPDDLEAEARLPLIGLRSCTAQRDHHRPHVALVHVADVVGEPPGERTDYSALQAVGLSDGLRINGTTSFKNRHSNLSAFSWMGPPSR